MSRRSYLPTLLRYLHVICTYIIRYREQMRHHLSDDANNALDALLLACQLFVELQPGG